MGGGQEDTNTVLGRSGVVPYVTAADLMIPAGTEPVEITLASQNGRSVAPLTGGSVGVDNVTINGNVANTYRPYIAFDGFAQEVRS